MAHSIVGWPLWSHASSQEIESFAESLDSYNGDFSVAIRDTRIDTSTNSLLVLPLVVELPKRDRVEPPTKLRRPLTEIVRRVAGSGIAEKNLRIRPSVVQQENNRTDQVFKIALAQGKSGLGAVACGEILYRLGMGEQALPVTHLSLVPDGDQWQLSARVLIVGDSE